MTTVVVDLKINDAIIIAAGASERLGMPKALIDINGETLIQLIIRKLKNNNLNVIIVTRQDLKDEILSFGEKVIINLNPENGRTGSIQYGLKEIQGKACIIVPVDRPGFSESTLQKLVQTDITSCPSKNGKGGHPVVISVKDCKKVLNSDPLTPLREIIDPLKIEVDDEFLHLNIDYLEDIEELKRMMISNTRLRNQET
ncbi:MAG: NTP transferase domain-containing protein [Candidatus Thalassarchaeaceae archaeon]|nr:NTP transferase domain-containing protein [Candidatus Thalassarchaeaceae archaeon]